MTQIPFTPNSEIRLAGIDATALCCRTAAAWCRSFSVHSPEVADRLALRLAAEVAMTSVDGDLEDILHRRAQELIADWFVSLGFLADGRAFDRLRHAFMCANSRGDLDPLFLGDERAGDRLVPALARFMPMATPPSHRQEMPRQRL